MDFNYLIAVFGGSKLILIVVVGFIFLVVLGAITSKNGKKRYKKNTQKERVNDSEFRSVPVLNKSEIRCFNQLKYFLHNLDPSLYLFPQVSMGEVVKANNFDGFSVTNSKRYDFLIVNADFKALVAVEYNGKGHYKNNYQDRDEAKKRATEKAGISLVSISYQDNVKDKLLEIGNLLTR